MTADRPTTPPGAAGETTHPAVDRSDGRLVVTETRAVVAYLSESRADLLVKASAAGRPVLLVSDEVTRLTYPMRQALRDAGGFWVVRGVDGTLRDGLDGRRLDRLSDAVRVPPVSSPEDVAIRYLRPEPPEAVQLMLSVSVRHKASATTVLGGTAELLATHLTGDPPRGWGAHEPAVVRWDRTALTELARRRMPHETLVTVAGGSHRPLSGLVRTARTEHGLEETTQVIVGVGAPGSDEARAAVDGLPDVARELAVAQMPLFGFVMARTGRADLTFPSVLETPPTPLGMLVGPPGVRQLDLDVRDLAERFDARILGRPRIPALWFPLGSFSEPGWPALDAVVDALGRDRVRALLDSAGQDPGEVLHAPE